MCKLNRENAVGEPPERLDYQNPRTPGERRVVRNFGLGLLVGLVASGVPWAVGAACQNDSVFLTSLIGVELAKIVAAVALATTGRHRGVAPGLLVSLGLAALVFGGLCFYALQHI